MWHTLTDKFADFYFIKETSRVISYKGGGGGLKALCVSGPEACAVTGPEACAVTGPEAWAVTGPGLRPKDAVLEVSSSGGLGSCPWRTYQGRAVCAALPQSLTLPWPPPPPAPRWTPWVGWK